VYPLGHQGIDRGIGYPEELSVVERAFISRVVRGCLVRFVVALILLALSTASLSVGIAQRTVFDEPDTIVRTVEPGTQAPATIIAGSELMAFPGRQTLTVTGGVSARVPDASGTGFERVESSSVFVAYGRTVDVMAWLSPGRHTKISYDAVADTFQSLPRSGELYLPNPRGSDLWFQEFSAAESVTFSLAARDDVTVLIMTDGLLPAPPVISIAWPRATEAPWILALIVVGVLSMVAGFVTLALAWAGWQKSQRPKRRNTRRMKPPRRATRPAKQSVRPTSVKKHGRRAARLLALPLAGIVLIGAGGCASEAPVANEQSEESEPEVQAPYPAVTEQQFATIMSRIGAQIVAGDEELSVNTLGVRVADPTLSARRAAYIVARADAESAAISPIPASPIRLVVPQQTQTWPRSVFGIIQDEQDVESPSLGVVIRQETPRSPYLLTYAVVLNPQVQLPDLLSASIGAPKLSADSKLTATAPSELLLHYADVVNNGADSPFAGEFALASDALYGQVGPDALALRQESFGDAVSVRWTTSVTDREIVAFSTADGGAIVLGTLQQTERVAPVQAGATVNSSIGIRALTSLSQSALGFDVDSHVQVLWYVPPVGSEEGIRVLGYTYSLIGAREVSNE
jgi:hypothetical protein